MAIELPNCRKSSTARLEPYLPRPNIAIELLNRPKLRIATELPN
jgi:hypothetical protein